MNQEIHNLKHEHQKEITKLKEGFLNHGISINNKYKALAMELKEVKKRDILLRNKHISIIDDMLETKLVEIDESHAKQYLISNEDANANKSS